MVEARSRTDLRWPHHRARRPLLRSSAPRNAPPFGTFDVRPEASVNEIEVYLIKGESVRPDAVRFFRSRPPGTWRNPLATEEGQPGVVFNWLEVEGPMLDPWPTQAQQLLFGDLPYTVNAKGVPDFESKDPAADSKRLIATFLQRAYRRPVPNGDLDRFTALFTKSSRRLLLHGLHDLRLHSGALFRRRFVTLEEKPGRLDNYALASRLSYFLWNSAPDAALLQNPTDLRAQTKRLLDDAVQAFLDYWLDLRKLNNTSPDPQLYPESYLDDFLVESAGDETCAFFTELDPQEPAPREISSPPISPC